MRSLAASLLCLIFVFSCRQNGKEPAKAPLPSPTSETKNRRVAADPSFFDAALNGNEATVMAALEKGVDVDSRDDEGRTALMYASFNGHTALIQKLIGKGASVDMQDGNGRSALMLAASGPFPVSVNVLLGNKANPNLVDREEHFTALMFAAAEGQLEVVKILLKYNADLTFKDVDGDDAITFAGNNGHKAVVDYLTSLKKQEPDSD